MLQSRLLPRILRRVASIRPLPRLSPQPPARCSSSLPPFPKFQRFATSSQWQALEQPQFESLVHQISRFSSMASPEITGKDGNPGSSADHDAAGSGEEKVEPVSTSHIPEEKGTVSEGNNAEGTSDGEVESSNQGAEQFDLEDLNKEELLGLLQERQDLLESKEKLITEMKDRMLRSLAEVENVRERARREAESTKKYAIQNFAKGLLDVADNLGRAAATVPETIRKGTLDSKVTDTSKLLKSLLEGVEMTEKQLMQVFKKHGVEKFDPVGQQFDPNQHLALFEVQDPSKDPGIVATVLKSGYKLYDRVIRPAEVGVVKAEGGAVENVESS